MTVASETRAKVPTSSSSRRRPGSAPLYRGSMSNPMNFKTDLNTPKKYPSKKMLKKSSQFLTEAEIDQMVRHTDVLGDVFIDVSPVLEFLE